MSVLRIYQGKEPSNLLLSSHNNLSIHRALKQIGVHFAQWLTKPLPYPVQPEQFVLTYQSELAQLRQRLPCQLVELLQIQHPDPQHNALRQQHLREQYCEEGELRFFAQGEGLLGLRLADKIYEIHCHTGDLIQIPAGVPHWFDIGPQPNLIAARLSSAPQFTPHETGCRIGEGFNRLED